MKLPSRKQSVAEVDAWAMSPADFPNKPKKNSGKRIVLVGANVKDDLLVLTYLSEKLAIFRSSIANALKDRRRWDVYDMSTKPEKGDVLDHLGSDVLAVITCHVSLCPPEDLSTDEETIQRLQQAESAHLREYLYNERNHELLPWCLANNVPLIAFGDQPVPMEEVVIEELIKKGLRMTVIFESPEPAILYEQA